MSVIDEGYHLRLLVLVALSVSRKKEDDVMNLRENYLYVGMDLHKDSHTAVLEPVHTKQSIANHREGDESREHDVQFIVTSEDFAKAFQT